MKTYALSCFAWSCRYGPKCVRQSGGLHCTRLAHRKRGSGHKCIPLSIARRLSTDKEENLIDLTVVAIFAKVESARESVQSR